MFTSRLLLAAVAITAVAAQNPLTDVSSFIAILNSANTTCSGRPACSGLAVAAPPCYGIINDQTSEAHCICTPSGALAFESCARCVAEDSCSGTGNAPLLLVPAFVNHCLPYVNGTVQQMFSSVAAGLVTSVTTTGACSTQPTTASVSTRAASSASPTPTPAPEPSTAAPTPGRSTIIKAPAPVPTSAASAPAPAPTTRSEQASAPSLTTMDAPVNLPSPSTSVIFVFPSDAPASTGSSSTDAAPISAAPTNVAPTDTAAPTLAPVQTIVKTPVQMSTLPYRRWLAQY